MRGTPFAERTIIVIDDKPLVVAGTAHELEDQGATVIQAHSSTELDNQIDRLKTDGAATVDYDLGDEPGPHAVDMIAAARGMRFPMLVVTGSTNTDTLQYLHRTGPVSPPHGKTVGHQAGRPRRPDGAPLGHDRRLTGPPYRGGSGDKASEQLQGRLRWESGPCCEGPVSKAVSSSQRS